jgi:hypothetical protein
VTHSNKTSLIISANVKMEIPPLQELQSDAENISIHFKTNTMPVQRMHFPLQIQFSNAIAFHPKIYLPTSPSFTGVGSISRGVRRWPKQVFYIRIIYWKNGPSKEW